jgi:stage V sporulation protein G
VEITEVRIKLMDEGSERLQAFCSITFDDCFVIRDLKIIEGATGPFVAMPSRKLTSHCPNCGAKNHLRANHCNDCGQRLNSNRAPIDEDGRAKLYADIAHPINSACREMIQDRVIREFHEELERAKMPGYVSRYDDYDLDDMPPARHSRGPARSHPTTNYGRSGNERSGGQRSGHGQNSSGGPRAPHRPPAAQPSRAVVQRPNAIDGELQRGMPTEDVPATAKAVENDMAALPETPKPKIDGFGDGIF